MKENKKIKNNSNTRRGFLQGLGQIFVGSAFIGTIANLFTASETKANASPPSFRASTDPLIGSISMVGFNWAPRNWAICNGSSIAISGNESLFSLIGTNFGGDGRTYFNLPDLQGRVPLGYGSGVGLTPRSVGVKGGYESIALSNSNLPQHNHSLYVNSAGGNTDSPSGTYLAANAEGIKQFSNTAGATANSAAIGDAGSSAAHENMMPFQVVNYVIAMFGTYPSRN